MVKEAKIKNNVKAILVEFPETRSSDNALIIKYAELHCKSKNKFRRSINGLRLMLKELPSTGSIRRYRRGLQKENPTLKAVKEVEDFRDVKEHETSLEMTGFADKGCTF